MPRRSYKEKNSIIVFILLFTYPSKEIIFPNVKRKANFDVLPKKNPTKELIERNCIRKPKAKQMKNPINLSFNESEGKQLSFWFSWPVTFKKKSFIFILTYKKIQRIYLFYIMRLIQY